MAEVHGAMAMKTQFHIRTYDSIPTDLAGEMRDWREFVSGEAYTVRLRDDQTGEEVSVCMQEMPEDFPTVIVEGPARSLLLARVLGRVVEALSEHNDNLLVQNVRVAGQLTK
jgi:hypothetical protein